WGAFHHRLRLGALSLLTGAFGTVVLLSSLYGALFVGIVKPAHFAFFYKYAALFLCTWLIVSSALGEEQIRFLLKMLFLSFLGVIGYEYYSLWNVAARHPELALTFRPNFPFTAAYENGGYLGDAHLLAAYLSSGLVAFVLFEHTGLMRMSAVAYYPLLALICGAMLLTGSRNGIVTSGFVFLLLIAFSVGRRFLVGRGITRMSRSSMRMCVGVLILCAAGLVFYDVYLQDEHSLQRVVARALSFDFVHDQSALGRIRKVGVAAAMVLDGPAVIGIGMQSSHMMFFDSGIGALLVTSGVTGIVLYASIILLFFIGLRKVAGRNGRESEYLGLFFVSLNYVLVNLITEFFLISRSVIPFCIFLGLMAKWIRINKCSHCSDMVA
ncbi:MAG: hypothetical protein ACM3VT_06490, partial [Solirubrobacterales bacterium]